MNLIDPSSLPVTHTLRKGWGFDVARNFARAASDLPFRASPAEHAHGGHLIGYLPENPASPLGFLRTGTAGFVRVHVPRAALAAVE